VLTAPAGLGYRWTTGDTTRSITVRSAGSYGVTVTDTFGCSAGASPVTITVDDAEATVVLGDASAGPGDRLSIPLYIANPGSIASCGVHDFTATISFDSIAGATLSGDSVGGTQRTITLKGRRGGDTLARILVTAALGSSESTPLRLEGFTWDDCAGVRTSPRGGTFTLTDICRIGGPRLIEITGPAALKPARPNPAGDAAIVEYELGESGFYELYLTDLLGNRVATLASGEAIAGGYIATLDAGALPAGAYFCVLRTATERVVREVRVER
jgi:hypothetical protein